MNVDPDAPTMRWNFHPITGQPTRRTVLGALVVGVCVGLLGGRLMPLGGLSGTERALSDERAERVAADDRSADSAFVFRAELDTLSSELRAMRTEVRSILAIVSRAP